MCWSVFKGPFSLILVLTGLMALPALADSFQQTNWSDGAVSTSPVSQWDQAFNAAGNVSWQAIPGQLSLSSSALDTPVQTMFNEAYFRALSIRGVDIDGDGDTDIIGTAEGSSRVILWRNGGGADAVLTEETIDDSYEEAAGVYPADIDGDGHLDVVGNSANSVVWWHNSGDESTVWTRQVIAPTWANAWEVYAHDVDLDGHMDVVCQDMTSGSMTWWHNDGADEITWTPHEIPDLFVGVHSVRLGDLDGDGDTDLVAVSGTVDEVAWWRNDGGTPISWTKTVIRGRFIGGRSVRVADMDNDQDLDIVGVSWDRDVTWWRNDGGQADNWFEQTIDADFAGGHHIEIADINGDGRLDVVGAAYAAHDVAWWENGGGEDIAWTRHNLITLYANAIDCGVGDINNDGTVDVLATSYYWGQFSWWKACEFVDSGSLTSSILDTQTAGAVTHVDWTAHVPANTSLQIRVRSGDDPANLGAWSAAISTPGVLPDPVGRYFQYEVSLESSDPSESPILQDITFGQASTGVNLLPDQGKAVLRPIWPNPFNPMTNIAFDLAAASDIRVSVYDVQGRQVARLADGFYSAGSHQVNWQGCNTANEPMPSGIYFVRLTTPEGQSVKKALMIR